MSSKDNLQSSDSCPDSIKKKKKKEKLNRDYRNKYKHQIPPYISEKIS